MLSTTSQYALRALVRLAAEPAREPVLGRELARECGIPANYLSKILLQLRNAGFISAVRGSGGGYKLEEASERIRLLDVVEIFEAINTRPECLLGQGDCSETDACSAHDAWKKVRRAYVEFLDANTLADIASGSGEEAQRSSLAAPGPAAAG